MAAAAQFSPVNTSMQHQQQQQYNFISSNAYYGYVPLPRAASSSGPQVDIISDDTHMLVDTPVVAVDEHHHRHHHHHQQRLCRKRGSDRCNNADLAGSFCFVQPKHKRFCSEAVVTNVFSMVQENNVSGQKDMDWPKCTMGHLYYA